jgi:phosphate starvation-inducible PhoH-like protein
MSKSKRAKDAKPDTAGARVTPDQICYKPRHDRQRHVEKIWHNFKVLVIVGPAGTGKTSSAIGMSLMDLMAGNIKKIMLGRPAIPIEEDLGFDPGTLDEKIAPWVVQFHDAVEGFSTAKLDRLASKIDYFSVGRVGGRTVRDAVMIVDEAQNLSRRQLSALVTRVGPNGKLVLCGDYEQSQVEQEERNNLYRLVESLRGKVDGFEVIEFLEEDQLRDKFVRDVTRVLRSAKY